MTAYEPQKPKKNKRFHKNIWYLLFFALVILYQYSDFINSRNVLWREYGESSNRGSVHILLICMIMYSCVYFIFSKAKVFKKNSFLSYICLLSFWSLLIELVTEGNYWMICIHSGLSLLWIFIFTMGYDIALQWEKTKKITYVFMYASFALSVYFFFYSYQNRTSTIGEGGVFNIAYNLLAFIPFFLLNTQRKFNDLLLIVAAVLIVVSLKRGAIIAFFLMSFFYLILKNDLHKKMMNVFLLLLVFTVFFSITIYYIDQYTGGMISQRFSAEEIQEGSGRSSQFSSAFNMWVNGSPLRQLFGFGATYTQSFMEIAIHNEFLSWLCYYGIIGLFLFIMFMRSMVKKQLELQKEMSPYSAIHVTILCYFLVASLVSGFFFMHSTMYYMLTLGIIVGLEDCRQQSDVSTPTEEQNLVAIQPGAQPEIPASQL